MERNCHFSASGWNCKAQLQAPQSFPNTSQGWLRGKIKLSGSCRDREVTVQLRFIIEGTL
jgi:hypothetical protein